MKQWSALALVAALASAGCGSTSSDRDGVGEQAVPYVSIVVTPNRADLTTGQTVQLKVSLVRAQGSEPVTGHFSSNNPTVAEVDEDTGVVKAIARGSTSIQASYASATTSVEINVR